MFDTAPKPTRIVQPEYTNEMKQARVAGLVTLRVLVNESGRVESAEVVNAAAPILAEKALAAVRAWEFEPATMKGEPVKATIVIPLQFQLER